MSKETANGYYTVYTRQSKKVLEELEKTVLTMLIEKRC